MSAICSSGRAIRRQQRSGSQPIGRIAGEQVALLVHAGGSHRGEPVGVDGKHGQVGDRRGHDIQSPDATAVLLADFGRGVADRSSHSRRGADTSPFEQFDASVAAMAAAVAGIDDPMTPARAAAGKPPAVFALGVQGADMLIHGWGLAVTTGQKPPSTRSCAWPQGSGLGRLSVTPLRPRQPTSMCPVTLIVDSTKPDGLDPF